MLTEICSVNKTKTEKQKVYAQHRENKTWMNDLLFFQDEIKVMKRRLSEIASRNTSKDVMAQLEHFQNLMIVQQNNIDHLKHRLNIGNDGIQAEIKRNVTAIDHRVIADNKVIRDKMESFTKVYTDNKKELNGFLSKWM
jgi:hypothetical protein